MADFRRITDAPGLDTLRGVPETLLIPLAARMTAAERYPDLAFNDPEAVRIGTALGFDPARFVDDTGSMHGSVIRALWFDRVARTFLARHGDGLCISIGSGLDDRSSRIGLPASAEWADVDFPDVIGLRDRLIVRRPNVRTATVATADPLAWIGKLDWAPGRPTLVIAEGVLMYLAPADGTALMRVLVARAAEAGSSLDLAADFASPFLVRHARRNPSIAKTSATFRWAVAGPEAVEGVAPGLKLMEAADIARQCGALSWLFATAHRLMTGRPIYFCGRYRYRPPGIA